MQMHFNKKKNQLNHSHIRNEKHKSQKPHEHEWQTHKSHAICKQSNIKKRKSVHDDAQLTTVIRFCRLRSAVLTVAEESLHLLRSILRNSLHVQFLDAPKWEKNGPCAPTLAHLDPKCRD